MGHLLQLAKPSDALACSAIVNNRIDNTNWIPRIHSPELITQMIENGIPKREFWAIFFGLDFIAIVPPTAKLSGKFFAKVNGPIVFGWIFGAHQLGSAVAAYGTGLSRDLLSTYVPVFLLAGLSCFVATSLFIYLISFRPKFSY